LVEVAGQVEQPAQVNGLGLVGHVLRPEDGHALFQGGEDVAGLAVRVVVRGRQMPGGRDVLPGRDEGQVDVVPGRAIVLADPLQDFRRPRRVFLVRGPDPVGPDGGPQEGPLDLGDLPRPVLGQVGGVVGVGLEDLRDLGLLPVVQSQVGDAGDRHVAGVVPGGGPARGQEPRRQNGQERRGGAHEGFPLSHGRPR
jgi:hypothetical protein